MQKLLKDLPKEQTELVEDIVPAQITVTGIQRVLQTLLASASRSATSRTILEGIAEGVAATPQSGFASPSMCARAWPARSAPSTPTLAGYLPLIALSPDWEQAFAEAIVGQGDERSSPWRRPGCPSSSPWCASASRSRAPGRGAGAADSPGIRPFVRSIVERFRAQTAGIVADRDPSPRPAQDRGKHLAQALPPAIAGLCPYSASQT